MLIAFFINIILSEANPNIDYTSLYWWLCGIVTFIMGIVSFLFKHKLKNIIIDSSPNPIIVLSHDGNDNKVINIEKSEMVDINNNIKSKVNEKVLELSKKYPLDTLDPYTNPFLLLGGRFQVSQTYNADIKSYINSMKEYCQREISHNVYSKVFAKVEFHLLGKGRKVCSNLHITVKFEGGLNHIYAANSLTTQVGYKDKEPKRQSESHFQGLFLTAPDKEKYNYNEWDLIHQENIIAVNVQRVTPGVVDTSSIPYFYIDTRYNQHIHINWKINGDDIKESGKTGTLEIVVK